MELQEYIELHLSTTEYCLEALWEFWTKREKARERVRERATWLLDGFCSRDRLRHELPEGESFKMVACIIKYSRRLRPLFGACPCWAHGYASRPSCPVGIQLTTESCMCLSFTSILGGCGLLYSIASPTLLPVPCSHSSVCLSALLCCSCCAGLVLTPSFRPLLPSLFPSFLSFLRPSLLPPSLFCLVLFFFFLFRSVPFCSVLFCFSVSPVLFGLVVLCYAVALLFPGVRFCSVVWRLTPGLQESRPLVSARARETWTSGSHGMCVQLSLSVLPWTNSPQGVPLPQL